jgi:hypothetical protein
MHVTTRPGTTFLSTASWGFEGGSVVTTKDNRQHIVTMMSDGVVMMKRTTPAAEVESKFDVSSCEPSPTPMAWTLGKRIRVGYGILMASGRTANKLFRWSPADQDGSVFCAGLPVDAFPTLAHGAIPNVKDFSISSDIFLLSEDSQLAEREKRRQLFSPAMEVPIKKHFFGLLTTKDDKKQDELEQKRDQSWTADVKLMGLARHIPRSDTPKSTSAERYLFVVKVKEVNGMIMRESVPTASKIPLKFSEQKFNNDIDLSFGKTDNAVLLSDGLSVAVGALTTNPAGEIPISRLIPCKFDKGGKMFAGDSNWKFNYRSGRFIQGAGGNMWHIGIATNSQNEQKAHSALVFQKITRGFISAYLSGSAPELKCFVRAVNHKLSGLIVDA